MFFGNHRIFKFLLLGLTLLPSFAHAQSGAVALSVLEEKNKVEAVVVQAEPEASTKTLSQLFFKGVTLYNDDKAGEAAVRFQATRDKASRDGYLNLTDFSITLLRQARLESQEGNKNSAKFLIHWADTLSPLDARVSLLSAGFSEVIGYGASVGKVFKSIGLLPRTPILLASLLLNLLLVGLTSFTIALFITALLQLSRNAESVVLNISQMIPLNLRGVLGPVLALIVLVCPLYLGLLPAVCVWSVLLGFFLHSSRWLPALAGATVICWGSGMLIAERVGPQLSLDLNYAVENVNNRTYAPQDKRSLAISIEENPGDLVPLFLYGQIVGQEGDHELSAQVFSKIIDQTRKKEDIHNKAKLNLAAVYLRNSKESEAGAILEDLLRTGEQSFEAYYNTAQVKMAALDPVGYRAMYQKAVDLDPDKIEWLEDFKSSEAVPIFASLPREGFLQRYFKRLLSKKVALPGEDVQLTKSLLGKDRVYSSLMKGGNLSLILLLGGITLLIGLFARFRKGEDERQSYDNSSFFGRKKSIIWHGFPCGGMVAGNRPVLGAILLGVLTSLVIISLQNPVELLPVSKDLFLEKGSFFLTIALGLFLLITSFTLLFHRESAARGGS